MLSKLVEGCSWSEDCPGHLVWLVLTTDDVCLLVGWIYNIDSTPGLQRFVRRIVLEIVHLLVLVELAEPRSSLRFLLSL